MYIVAVRFNAYETSVYNAKSLTEVRELQAQFKFHDVTVGRVVAVKTPLKVLDKTQRTV